MKKARKTIFDNLVTYYISVLSEVALDAKYGHIRVAEEIGLSIDTIRSLVQLDISQLNLVAQKMAECSSNFQNVNSTLINDELVMNSISSALAMEKEETLIKEFIVNGATTEIMQSYFGLTSLQTTNLVKLSGITKSKGRKSKVPTKVQDYIYNEYLNFLDVNDMRERILTVAKSTQKSVFEVCLTVDCITEVMNRKNDCA